MPVVSEKKRSISIGLTPSFDHPLQNVLAAVGQRVQSVRREVDAQRPSSDAEGQVIREQGRQPDQYDGQ